jgi:hypothetical protein
MSFPRRLLLLAGLVSGALVCGAFADGPALTEVEADEQTLTEVGVGTDPAALRDYFRRLVPSPEGRARLAELVRRLGDRSYAVRETATAELARTGAPARPMLRDGLQSPDPEVTRRARIALAASERIATPAVPCAAAHLLAVRAAPADAAGDADLLLDCLPGAEDELLGDELRAALAALVRKASAPGPGVRAALVGADPLRRAAAGAALAALPTTRPLVQPLLGDPDPQVRLRVAVALARSGERGAVPVLIDLLAELPLDQAQPAEELLGRLAGDGAPGGSDGPAGRDAWKTWWSGPGAATDLAALAEEPSGRTGGTLIVYVTTPGRGGSVFEQGPGGPRWHIDGLATPVDAVMVGPRRVLVAEFSGNRVTERDLSGTVVWEKTVPVPLACRRLPGGKTFIAGRDRLLEVDRDGRERVILSRSGDEIKLAARFRDGWCAFVTRSGRCTVTDPAGQERASWAVAAGAMYGQMEALPNGNLLVPEYAANRVAEYDRTGRLVWQAPAPQVISATRAPGGRTLAVNQQGQQILELDRSGKVVGQHHADRDASPWVARR